MTNAIESETRKAKELRQGQRWSLMPGSLSSSVALETRRRLAGEGDQGSAWHRLVMRTKAPAFSPEQTRALRKRPRLARGGNNEVPF